MAHRTKPASHVWRDYSDPMVVALCDPDRDRPRRHLTDGVVDQLLEFAAKREAARHRQAAVSDGTKSKLRRLARHVMPNDAEIVKHATALAAELKRSTFEQATWQAIRMGGVTFETFVAGLEALAKWHAFGAYFHDVWRHMSKLKRFGGDRRVDLVVEVAIAWEEIAGRAPSHDAGGAFARFVGVLAEREGMRPPDRSFIQRALRKKADHWITVASRPGGASGFFGSRKRARADRIS